MQILIYFSGMALAALLTAGLVGGCASSPVQPSPAQSSGIFIEQVPTTGHMRSQVGTPNELSPLAPAEAKNMRKVGAQWCCELSGQPHVFNSATSRWEPQRR